MRKVHLRRLACAGLVPVAFAVVGLAAGCDARSGDVGATSAVESTSSNPSTEPNPEPEADPKPVAGPRPVADDAARSAAVGGLTAYLSYRGDTIEEDADEARALSTSDFWAESSNLWNVLTEQAPARQTISDITVLANGVVSQDEEQGTYLVFLDQESSASGGQVTVSHESVLVSVAGGPVAAAEQLVRAMVARDGDESDFVLTAAALADIRADCDRAGGWLADPNGDGRGRRTPGPAAVGRGGAEGWHVGGLGGRASGVSTTAGVNERAPGHEDRGLDFVGVSNGT